MHVVYFYLFALVSLAAVQAVHEPLFLAQHRVGNATTPNHVRLRALSESAFVHRASRVRDVCNPMQSGTSCTCGYLLCSGRCLDGSADPQNCGACGNHCDPLAGVCAGSVCSDCPSPEISCNNQCTTPDSTQNCGSCGNDCSQYPDTFCNSFDCTCLSEGILCKPAKKCISFSTICPFTPPPLSCGDTTASRMNCGGCDLQCVPGSICVASSCTQCVPPDGNQCNNQCVNLSSDTSNCGQCGKACAAKTSFGLAASCVSGQCQCPSGFVPCAGANLCLNQNTFCPPGPLPMGTCGDTLETPVNCGACGLFCTETSVCTVGVCTQCGPEELQCGNKCTDILGDSENCGQCDFSCATVSPGYTCVSGQCVP